MLRIDLDAAGIAYRDEEGRVADFHALRHSYITLLSRSGVSPKVAQELARHSDIRLTMNVYTHTGLFDLAGAVDSMPALMPTGPVPERTVLRATGTEGHSRLDRALTKPLRADGPRLRANATRKEQGSDDTPVIRFQRKMLEDEDFGSTRDPMAKDDMAVEEELPGQDSNLDKENQNLLCYRYTTEHHESSAFARPLH